MKRIIILATFASTIATVDVSTESLVLPLSSPIVVFSSSGHVAYEYGAHLFTLITFYDKDGYFISRKAIPGILKLAPDGKSTKPKGRNKLSN